MGRDLVTDQQDWSCLTYQQHASCLLPVLSPVLGAHINHRRQ